MRVHALSFLSLVTVAGCAQVTPPDDDMVPDASKPDTSAADAAKEATPDTGVMDSGDSGVTTDAADDVASDAGVADAAPDAPSSTLLNGLVGLWNLDETQAGTAPNNTDFKDESGQGNHGTATGGAMFGVQGKLAKAAQLDGSKHYVLIPDSNSLRPSNVSISVWFSMTMLPGNTGVAVLTKPQKGPPPWAFPYQSWMIRVNAANKIEANIGTSGSYCGAFSVASIQTGTWHQAVLTYDGSTVTFYFDGQSAGTCKLNGAIAYGAYPVILGGDYGASPVADYFPGTIDQVGIWSRVLTSSELSDLYGGGNGFKLP